MRIDIGRYGRKEDTAKLQAKDDGGLHQGGRNRRSGWSVNIFKSRAMGLASSFNVENYLAVWGLH